MRCLKAVAVVAVCLSLLAGPTVGPAAATEVSTRLSQAESVRTTTTTVPRRERDTLDRITSVAAVASILIAGVAGVYIYRLIRKGL